MLYASEPQTKCISSDSPLPATESTTPESVSEDNGGAYSSALCDAPPRRGQIPIRRRQIPQSVEAPIPLQVLPANSQRCQNILPYMIVSATSSVLGCAYGYQAGKDRSSSNFKMLSAYCQALNLRCLYKMSHRFCGRYGEHWDAVVEGALLTFQFTTHTGTQSYNACRYSQC